jgi:hypothetical protein
MQMTGLPFADVLPEEKIQQAFDEEGIDFASDGDDENERVYTPPITVWAFLSQTLFKQEQRSCAAAVARVVTLVVALGREPCSDNTGAYCRARAKLTDTVLRRMACDVAVGCEKKVPKSWLWFGHHVKLVDGSTVSMPDTEDNQEAFPQHTAQEEGLGFPIARIVGLLSLATGMMVDCEIGPYSGKETGETAMLRKMLDQLNKNDILLADRYFCSYFMIAMLLELRVLFVVRLHQRRTANFRRGKRLGKADHLIEWKRPDKPDWMDQETYESMPESIQVRELKVHIDQPGFRSESFVVVTTLTDAQKYPKEEVADLYRKRWLVELDIRSIKTTMGMDVLRCKTPAMVHKEIWTHLLAYNLIRQTMFQAAKRSDSGLAPRQLSFAAAMQKIAAVWMLLPVSDETTALSLIEVHLSHIASNEVGDRPDRVEPRAVKRRPKPLALLTKPRREAREELLAGKA